jgi:hypothetical protein
MRRDRAALVLAALVVLVHAAWFAAFRWRTTPDTPQYLAAARGLREGRGFVNAGGEPETFRTPGYPLLVAAAGLHPNAIVILQHAMIVAAAAMTAWFLRERPVEAMVALALLGFDTALLASAGLLMTEALFVFVMQAGVLALLIAMRRGSAAIAAAAGLLIGFAPLVRPIAVAVALPLIVIAAMHSRVRRVAVAFALPALILPSLWVARNDRAAGVPTLSTVADANMLYWRAAGTLAMSERPVNESDYQRRFFAIQARMRSDPDADARAIIAAHPMAFLRSAVNGDLHLLFDPAPDLPMRLGWPGRELLLGLLLVLRVAIVIAAIIGLARLWRSDRALALVCGSLIAYFLALSAGPEANFLSIRFRAPIVPFEAMAAAFAVGYRKA